MSNFSTSRRVNGARSRAARTLLYLLLCMVALPAIAVHPYERWARDFGIDPNVSYDGKRILEMEEGVFEMSERKAPGKMFTEVHLQGMTSGVILREDLDKTWILLPATGYYREESLKDGQFQVGNGIEFSEVDKVGREAYIGHASTKYKVRFKDKEGKGSGHVWVTDSGVPIKLDLVYSSRGQQGKRYTIRFTELNLREQDPAVFELPEGLKLINFGGMAGLDSLTRRDKQPTAAAVETTKPLAPVGDVDTEQQACLERAMQAAQERQEAQKKKRGFGRLMSAVSRTAHQFGVTEVSRATAGIYSANATASDVSAAARDLGLTEEEVERCRKP